MENEKIRKEIGERLKYIRDQKGMNSEEFARYIKTTKQQLSYVLRGQRGFSLAKLIEISEITGYPIEFILTGKKSNIDHNIKKQIEEINKQINEAINTLNNITALIK